MFSPRHGRSCAWGRAVRGTLVESEVRSLVEAQLGVAVHEDRADRRRHRAPALLPRRRRTATRARSSRASRRRRIRRAGRPASRPSRRSSRCAASSRARACPCRAASAATPRAASSCTRTSARTRSPTSSPALAAGRTHRACTAASLAWIPALQRLRDPGRAPDLRAPARRRALPLQGRALRDVEPAARARPRRRRARRRTRCARRFARDRRARSRDAPLRLAHRDLQSRNVHVRRAPAGGAPRARDDRLPGRLPRAARVRRRRAAARLLRRAARRRGRGAPRVAAPAAARRARRRHVPASLRPAHRRAQGQGPRALPLRVRGSAATRATSSTCRRRRARCAPPGARLADARARAPRRSPPCSHGFRTRRARHDRRGGARHAAASAHRASCRSRPCPCAACRSSRSSSRCSTATACARSRSTCTTCPSASRRPPSAGAQPGLALRFSTGARAARHGRRHPQASRRSCARAIPCARDRRRHGPRLRPLGARRLASCAAVTPRASSCARTRAPRSSVRSAWIARGACDGSRHDSTSGERAGRASTPGRTCVSPRDLRLAARTRSRSATSTTGGCRRGGRRGRRARLRGRRRGVSLGAGRDAGRVPAAPTSRRRRRLVPRRRRRVAPRGRALRARRDGRVSVVLGAGAALGAGAELARGGRVRGRARAGRLRRDARGVFAGGAWLHPSGPRTGAARRSARERGRLHRHERRVRRRRAAPVGVPRARRVGQHPARLRRHHGDRPRAASASSATRSTRSSSRTSTATTSAASPRCSSRRSTAISGAARSTSPGRPASRSACANVAWALGHPIEGRELGFALRFRELPRRRAHADRGLRGRDLRDAPRARGVPARRDLPRRTAARSPTRATPAGSTSCPRASRGADLFLCECTQEQRGYAYHLSLEELEPRRRSFDCGRILLTHLGARDARRGGLAASRSPTTASS